MIITGEPFKTPPEIAAFLDDAYRSAYRAKAAVLREDFLRNFLAVLRMGGETPAGKLRHRR